jgi:hypothetical protein
MDKQNALDEYETKQAEIKKLLKQIEVGLQKHDRNDRRLGAPLTPASVI